MIKNTRERLKKFIAYSVWVGALITMMGVLLHEEVPTTPVVVDNTVEVRQIVEGQVEDKLAPVLAKIEEQEKQKAELEKKKAEEARLNKIKTTLVTRTALNVRSEAKIGDNIKSVITKGSEVNVYKEDVNKDWYKLVDESNGVKYVNKNYLVTPEKYKKILQEELTLAKKNANKKKAPVTRGGQVSGRKVTVEVTHYCPCTICSDGWGRKTASVKTVQVGMVAAPKAFPFGTKININGTVYTVEDRGGAIVQKGNVYKIDIFVHNHQEALRKGRYTTTAIVY